MSSLLQKKKKHQLLWRRYLYPCTISAEENTFENAGIIFICFHSYLPFHNVFTSLKKCYWFRSCAVNLYILLISFLQAFGCLQMSGPQAVKFAKQTGLKYSPSKGSLFNFCKSALRCFPNLTYVAYVFVHTSFIQWVSKDSFVESPNSILPLFCTCFIFGWFANMNNQQCWQSVYSHLNTTILAA